MFHLCLRAFVLFGKMFGKGNRGGCTAVSFGVFYDTTTSIPCRCSRLSKKGR